MRWSALGTVKTCSGPGRDATIRTSRCPGRSGDAFHEPLRTSRPTACNAPTGSRTSGPHARRSRGFEPDLVVVNTGWGENLFLKDVWPKARHVAYLEYYYRAKGTGPRISIRNSRSATRRRLWRLRIKNAMQLGAFDAADAAVAPTRYPARHCFRPICASGSRSSTTASTRDACGPIRAPRSASARTGRALDRATPGRHLRDAQHRADARLPHRDPEPAGPPRPRPAPAGRHPRRHRTRAIGRARRTGEDWLDQIFTGEREGPARLVPGPFRRAGALRRSSSGCSRSPPPTST